MKLKLHQFNLPLEHKFTIARGSLTVQRSLVVELQHDGCSGFGESTSNSYYGFTIDSMMQSVERCRHLVESYSFGTPHELWERLKPELTDDIFALSAIDLAAHDLFGKLSRQPNFKLFGLRWENIPDSSYTIGIDSIETMVAKLNERPNWQIYKIKLGTDRDVDIIRELRRHTSAVFRVDANCGWTADKTIENSRALKELGVEFIEQPLPADAAEGDQRRVYSESVLPIIADESCLLESDVLKCHERFDGINVKLCKCGGLTPAFRMLQKAQSLGMKTMVGCMIESSVGISAAAQLLPLLNYADLDGAVLLAEDVASGVTIKDGRVTLSRTFGNGVTLL